MKKFVSSQNYDFLFTNSKVSPFILKQLSQSCILKSDCWLAYQILTESLERNKGCHVICMRWSQILRNELNAKYVYLFWWLGFGILCSKTSWILSVWVLVFPDGTVDSYRCFSLHCYLWIKYAPFFFLLVLTTL